MGFTVNRNLHCDQTGAGLCLSGCKDAEPDASPRKHSWILLMSRKYLQVSLSLQVRVSDGDNDPSPRDTYCGETRRISCPQSDGGEAETRLEFHRLVLISASLGKGLKDAEGSDTKLGRCPGPAPYLRAWPQ